ncbi:hypothetical protein [Streptomyces sp. NPDC057748]|uniref:hypothetical protein n=1 Tax=unclassified Streptomyces TaxID=2593676 RepID=UPI0036B70CF6
MVVHAERQGRRVTHRTRAAVVALPVAVPNARAVEVSPVLPREKTGAFKAVPRFAISKVLMEFARSVFSQDADHVVEAGVPWWLRLKRIGCPQGRSLPRQLMPTELLGEPTHRQSGGKPGATAPIGLNTLGEQDIPSKEPTACRPQ